MDENTQVLQAMADCFCRLYFDGMPSVRMVIGQQEEFDRRGTWGHCDLARKVIEIAPSLTANTQFFGRIKDLLKHELTHSWTIWKGYDISYACGHTKWFLWKALQLDLDLSTTLSTWKELAPIVEKLRSGLSPEEFDEFALVVEDEPAELPEEEALGPPIVVDWPTDVDFDHPEEYGRPLSLGGTLRSPPDVERGESEADAGQEARPAPAVKSESAEDRDRIVAERGRIIRRISQIVAEVVGVDEGSLTLETRFAEDLGVDAPTMSLLLAHFNKEFHLWLRDAEAEQVRRLWDVYKRIRFF